MPFLTHRPFEKMLGFSHSTRRVLKGHMRRREFIILLGSAVGDRQSCPFPIQRNRDRISTCKFDVGMMKRSSVNFGSR
jgi:hypothetical protein